MIPGIVSSQNLMSSVETPDFFLEANQIYSLRKIIGDVSIRVRRAQDNSERDIGFKGKHLDIGTLEAFADGYDVIVTTLYDQSGNGNHWTQATSANQAKIVSSGSTILVNNKPALLFSGDQYYFQPPSGLTTFRRVGYASVFTVVQPDSEPYDLSGCILEYRNNANASRVWLSLSHPDMNIDWGGRRLDSDSFARAGDSGDFGKAQILFSGFIEWALANCYSFVNGNQVAANTSFQTTGNTSNTSSSSISFGSNGTNTQPYFGKVQEVIVYNTERRSRRAGIEQNVMRYWL